MISPEFKAAAIAAHPNEVCALVYGGEVHIVPNISNTPLTSYKIHHSEIVKALASPTGLTGVIHSHPHPHSDPSPADIVAQSRLCCVFAIVTTDGHAVTDIRIWGSNESIN